jgi:polar amino acid transport system substrate-binding protein
MVVLSLLGALACQVAPPPAPTTAPAAAAPTTAPAPPTAAPAAKPTTAPAAAPTTAAAAPTTASVARANLKTIEPGVLNVAMNGDLPMTTIKDGKLQGSDGEMISLIAERLGLKTVPHQMEWAAEIESTKAGRVDLMLGAMGWIQPRTEIMFLTDPIYYFGTLLAQKMETNYSTFEDMADKNVGTVTGFTLVPELKQVPNIKEVKLYDTSDGVMRDLVEGRLDIAILDPPLVELAAKEHPDWNLHQVALKADPKYPIMSTKYNVIMGVKKDQIELGEAINAEIRKLWASCENKKMMAKYGVVNPDFFVPPDPDPRVGVDRGADYKAPTLPANCPA